MHILYLHSSGYLIFKAKEFEEIGIAIQSVKKSYDDFKKFSSLIKLEMFYPFNDIDTASYNWHSIVKEKTIPSTMKMVLNKFGRKKIQSLGVDMSFLTKALKETLEIKVSSNAFVMEITRCIRYHMPSILKKYGGLDKDKLFRKSLIFNAGGADFVSSTNGINVTNNFNLLNDIESTIPVKIAALRKLLKPFFPELTKCSLINNEDLPKFISIYFDDSTLEKLSEYQKILGEEKTCLIQKAMKNTIGQQMSKIDKDFIKQCSDEVLETIKKYESCKVIACNATKNLAPNLSTFLDLSSVNANNSETNIDMTATTIIAKAGSLKKLAEKSSTAIHTQNKKNDSLLKRKKDYTCQRSALDKLRSVEMKSLSDKCALAARMDYFGSQNTDGERLDDTFGRECHKSHLLRMSTWANNNAINVATADSKDEVKKRIQKYKLKRKEKKKIWRQRKNERQRDVLFASTIVEPMDE